MTKQFREEFIEQFKNLLEYLAKEKFWIENQADKLDEIFEMIENGESLHIYGKGRSGSIAVSLALRLKHFGYNVWFIGDVIKEKIKPKDVVLLFSGSGETSELVDIAKKAKGINAKVIAITSYKNSSLAKNSDVVFTLPGGLEKKKGWDYLEAQLNRKSDFYGGGEFELYAYLFQEALLSAIGKFKKIPHSIVAKRHERDEVI
ncbi:MAG: SIS domain-containing protein [Candidatus Bathyarchaeia archaeon]